MPEDVTVQIQVQSYYYRGQIIGDLIYLERLIDEFISRHFCETREKQKEIFELILANERMGFSNKIQVFEFVIRTHKNEFMTLNPNIFSDLKKLNDERNIVAHYFLDTSENGRKVFLESKSIGFVKFRNSTETLWRSNNEYLKFKALLSEYTKKLTELLT